MMILRTVWIAFLTVLITSCGATTSNENNNNTDVVGLNATLTQVLQAVSEEDCPNGGVTLEHGIDLNADGTLSEDEVTHTYAICHGVDGTLGETGPTGPAGSDAEVSAVLAELDELRDELVTLRAEVQQNTNKVGITGEQAAAIEANTVTNASQDVLIAENALRAGITPEQSLAIEFNTTKVGITVSQAGAIEANADALFNIGSNPAFDGWDKSVVDDADFITTETDPVASAAGYASVTDVVTNTAAIGLNTAKVGITEEQAVGIATNTDALIDLGNNSAFDGWDKSVVDDADFITNETDPVASAAGYLTSESDPIATDAGYVTTAWVNGQSYLTSFTETDPVASAAGYLTSESDPIATGAGYVTAAWVGGQGYLTSFTETDPVASAAGYLTSESDPITTGAGYVTAAWVGGQGYLTSFTETDPVASAAGYLTSYTETDPVASAAGYLTSFTESDPVASAAGYLISFTESDPVASAAGYATESWVGAQGYLAGFTESDPVFSGDADNDGVANAEDNCPTIANSNQLDADRDNTGDACDAYNPPYVPSADGELMFTRCPSGIDFLTSFVECRYWNEQAGGSSSFSFNYCTTDDAACDGGDTLASGASEIWVSCSSLNLGGYSDWRVPTRSEMTVWYTDIRAESLIDTNGWYSSHFWTSDSYNSSSGYYMDTSGNFFAESKSTNNQVYCVRGSGS